MNKVTTFTPESPVVALPATARIGEHVMSAFDPQSACDERTAWLFPGLGCRYVGMGHDLIGRHPVADQLIAAAEARLPYSISEVCLEGSGRKYVPPRQEAQVIYVLDCAYAAVLRDRGHQPAVIAGHSLGSLAAGHAAGAYDFMTGLELVTRIEDLMEESIDGHGQAMGVVIGLDEPAICKLLQDAPGTAVANWNSPLQHVLGGPATNVDHALKLALQRGAKQARRFAFERAMHTPLMESVAVRFRESLADITWNDPEVPFVDSHDASVLRTAARIQQFLGGFLSQPVHWQATIQTILHGWGSRFVEVGPGNVLTSMLPFIQSTATARTASDVLDQKVEL